MLPTTGYFKNISCPFYETCICERPYCHYRHFKSDLTHDNLIENLVSKAVNKVLKTQEDQEDEKKVTYNPTPIATLNKFKNKLEKKSKHIPYSPEPCAKKPEEYSVEYSTGYNPTSSQFSYTPSAIENISGLNQSYEPEQITPSDTLDIKYKPTNNDDLVTNTDNDYVPNYNDDFIETFLSDPNIYEPTEIQRKNDDSTKLETHERLKESTHDTAGHKTDSKSKSRSSSSSSSNKKSTDKSKDKSKSSDKSHRTKDRSKSKSSSDRHDKDKKVDSKSKSSSSDEKKSKENKHRSSNGKSSSSSSKHKSRHDKDRDKHKKSSKHKTKEKERDPEVFALDSDINISSEDDMEQCKRIFEEYQPPPKEPSEPKDINPDVSLKEETISARKRVAHEATSNLFVLKPKILKPNSVKSAAVVMSDRYRNIMAQQKDKLLNGDSANHKLSEIQSTYKRTETTEPLKPSETQVKATQSNAQFQPIIETTKPAIKNSRIAHVPNVSLLLNAKKKVAEIAKKVEINKTQMSTVPKGSKRVAHVPDFNIADIPKVLQAEKSKLPVNVRDRFLSLMVTECIKIYMDKESAYERALNEELACYSKCSVLTTYRNSAMLSVNRLRKEAEGISSTSVQKKTNWASEFTGNKFYANMHRWILSEEELVDNGFPRPSVRKGSAIFKNDKIIQRVPQGSQLCVRCKKIYPVNEDGFPLYPEDCIYHPGRRFVFRGEAKYICCRDSALSEGCSICSSHVFEIRDPSCLTGFVKTFDPEQDDDKRSAQVFALDCEMVYTTRGFELARITVINEKCDVVYESKVKPTGSILDCNTRFSGLTQESLQNVTTRITDIQAALLLLFNSQTILIGHSLESDLKALRLIHSTVVDTSVLFPHKMGPPKKRGLRSLASDYLKKIIQNDEGGHDSAEDAITCMELVKWKLQEELKTR